MGQEWSKFLFESKGKILGAILGLILGWISLRYGIFRALMVAIFLGVGLYIGYRFDRKDNLADILEGFWPGKGQ